MGIKLLWIFALSALFAAGFRLIFPRVRNWVPTVLAASLLPLGSALLTVYKLLIVVGLSANGGNSVPPGTIDGFTGGLNSVLIFVPIAVVLAVVTSLAVLHLMPKRPSA